MISSGKRLIKIISISRLAFKGYEKKLALLTILGFFGGVLEGVGVNALIPLLSFATGSDMGGNDAISRALRSMFEFVGVSFNIKFLLIFIATLFILKAFVLVIINFIRISIVADYEEKTRSRLYKKFLNSNWEYLMNQKLGRVENILMTDVRYGSTLLHQASATIMTLTGFLVYIVIAFNISMYITIVTLLTGAVFFLFLKPILYRTRKIAQKVSDTNKDIAHSVNESIMGLKTIKSLCASQPVAKEGEDKFYWLKKLRKKSFIYTEIVGTVIEPLSVVFITVVFALSFKSPEFSIATFGAVVYLIHHIFIYVQRMQASLNNVNESSPYVKNIIQQEEEAEKNYEAISKGKVEKFVFKNKLSVKNLFFSYVGADRDVLKDINFSISKGDLVGFIGPSGAGKTTLVDLLLRLFEPKSGEILLDGVNINDIDLLEWRKSVGYVSQDIFLLNDTIENNIRFYDDSISKNDIEKSSRLAYIHDFIKTLPEGYQTTIGERGMRVSAGQRQRIAIARVLARNPQILILDEATSALDNESEMMIQKFIENLKGKITVLVIAHRLSTIMNSDRLISIENGEIVEIGKPNELLKDETSYFYKVNNIRQ